VAILLLVLAGLVFAGVCVYMVREAFFGAREPLEERPWWRRQLTVSETVLMLVILVLAIRVGSLLIYTFNAASVAIAITVAIVIGYALIKLRARTRADS
jgi:hypothetical protein